MGGGALEQGQFNWIANFIWGIADDVLRDLYVRGKYHDVILPMTVLHRFDWGVQTCARSSNSSSWWKPTNASAR